MLDRLRHVLPAWRHHCALLESLNLSLKDPAILASPIPLAIQVSYLAIHPLLALIAVVRAVVSSDDSMLARHGVIYPARGLAYRGVHTRSTILSTAYTPGNHPCLDIGARVILGGTDKGASSISFAGVLAIDSSCTDEGVMELVLLS